MTTIDLSIFLIPIVLLITIFMIFNTIRVIQQFKGMIIGANKAGDIMPYWFIVLVLGILQTLCLWFPWAKTEYYYTSEYDLKAMAEQYNAEIVEVQSNKVSGFLVHESNLTNKSHKWRYFITTDESENVERGG